MTTDIDTVELRQLLVRATPRPWYLRGGRMLSRHPDGKGMGGHLETHHLANFAQPEDAALVAAAVNALPALLDRVDELESDMTSACMSAQFAMDAICEGRGLLAERVAKLEATLLLARDALDDMMGDTDIEEDDSKAFTTMQTIADVLSEKS